jgi:hypothetical protein
MKWNVMIYVLSFNTYINNKKITFARETEAWWEKKNLSVLV